MKCLKITWFLSLFIGLIGYCSAKTIDVNISQTKSYQEKIKVGAEQLDLYLPKLKGKKVGLVVNQTSMINNHHLVDVLLAHQIDIQVIFAPEHGFRGDHDAGAKVNNSLDKKTGIPLVSIYGKHKQPPTKLMNALDVIVFDIQDVGVRFYTYISSMQYMMQAASKTHTNFIVLDRPNPNGMYVDGPILEKAFSSFVGMQPIPLLHGMTIGELAQMIKGEGWIDSADQLKLTIIKMLNYHHQRVYSLPIKPSPNLPNDLSIALYPSLAFFEATPISIGRGTSFPFQVIGHDKVALGDYKFIPISIPGAALTPKLMNKQLTGTRFYVIKKSGLDLTYLLTWYHLFKEHHMRFFSRPTFFDKLAGTDKLRLAIESGKSLDEIKQSWQQDLAIFKAERKPYLLYPETYQQ